MKHLSKSIASLDRDACVACGCCLKVCPRQALSIYRGSYAVVDTDACVGCGRCEKECPASVIKIQSRGGESNEASKNALV